MSKTGKTEAKLSDVIWVRMELEIDLLSLSTNFHQKIRDVLYLIPIVYSNLASNIFIAQKNLTSLL